MKKILSYLMVILLLVSAVLAFAVPRIKVSASELEPAPHDLPLVVEED
ncbi:MAG: hypothetical protein ACOX56_05865 [Acholeplasmataceae bacterium]|jgi:hypothetical protein